MKQYTVGVLLALIFSTAQARSVPGEECLSNTQILADPDKLRDCQSRAEIMREAISRVEVREAMAGRAGADARSQVETWLDENLIDPRSKIVSSFKISANAIACARVNSRNTFGGYTGPQWMVATFTPQGKLKQVQIFDNKLFAYASINESHYFGVYHEALRICGAI